MSRKALTGRARALAASAPLPLAAPQAALAAPGYALPTSGATGILASIETTLVELADFMSGPFGVFVVILGFIIAGTLWVFAPRSGALNIAVRAIAAVIVVFNLTAIITYFTYG